MVPDPAPVRRPMVSLTSATIHARAEKQGIDCLRQGDTEIWYLKPGMEFHDYRWFPGRIDMKNLEATHRLVAAVKGTDPEALWCTLQTDVEDNPGAEDRHRHVEPNGDRIDIEDVTADAVEFIRLKGGSTEGPIRMDREEWAALAAKLEPLPNQFRGLQAFSAGGEDRTIVHGQENLEAAFARAILYEWKKPGTALKTLDAGGYVKLDLTRKG